jgi:hypothetical protein
MSGLPAIGLKVRKSAKADLRRAAHGGHVRVTDMGQRLPPLVLQTKTLTLALTI